MILWIAGITGGIDREERVVSRKPQRLFSYYHKDMTLDYDMDRDVALKLLNQLDESLLKLADEAKELRDSHTCHTNLYYNGLWTGYILARFEVGTIIGRLTRAMRGGPLNEVELKEQVERLEKGLTQDEHRGQDEEV